MKGLVPISELFEPVYGVNLELLNMHICNRNDSNSIRFISRKESDNGLAAYVKKVDGVLPNPAHTISVAVSGSVLSSFYQDEEYYSGRDIYYLKPKNKMTVEEMLYYALCLQANKYKYNYGRGANRTLRHILVPKSMPAELMGIQNNIDVPSNKPILTGHYDALNIDTWKPFKLGGLFDILKGKRLTKEDMNEGNTPFIGAIDSDNGWSNYIDQPGIFKANVITVNYDGNGVAEAFYQPVPFWALDSVNVLYPKFQLNKYIALFICTIIRKEKFRFSYGRKWNRERMIKSHIYLPAVGDKPDFAFMENYIKSLPYSAGLTKNETVVKITTRKKKAGLSDEELVKKYEGGKVPMRKIMKALLTTSPPENDPSKNKKR